MWHKNVDTIVSFVLSQSTRFTDGQTDRWLSHDYTVPCITCSRTVKMAEFPAELNVTTKTDRSRLREIMKYARRPRAPQ